MISCQANMRFMNVNWKCVAVGVCVRPISFNDNLKISLVLTDKSSIHSNIFIFFIKITKPFILWIMIGIKSSLHWFSKIIGKSVCTCYESQSEPFYNSDNFDEFDFGRKAKRRIGSHFISGSKLITDGMTKCWPHITQNR